MHVIKRGFSLFDKENFCSFKEQIHIFFSTVLYGTIWEATYYPNVKPNNINGREVKYNVYHENGLNPEEYFIGRDILCYTENLMDLNYPVYVWEPFYHSTVVSLCFTFSCSIGIILIVIIAKPV